MKILFYCGTGLIIFLNISCATQESVESEYQTMRENSKKNYDLAYEKLFLCAYKYSRAHVSSTATATEIAEATESTCSSQYESLKVNDSFYSNVHNINKGYEDAKRLVKSKIIEIVIAERTPK